MVRWICRGGVAPGAAPKADATGMAPEKSAGNPLVIPEGFLFTRARRVAGAASPRTLLPAVCAGSHTGRRRSAGSEPISLVNPPSGGLGLGNAKIGGLARRTL